MLPPGPSIHALRQIADFGAHPYAFLAKCRAEYGPVFTWQMPGSGDVVVVADPDEVARLFAMKADDLDASEPDLPMDLGRGSLLVLNGKQHLKDRRLMTPPLHGERLRSYGDTMVAVADEAIDRWLAQDGVVVGRDAMQWVTFQVILRCVFGFLDGPVAERLTDVLLRWMDASLSTPVATLGLLLGPRRVRRALRRAGQDLSPGDRPLLPHKRIAALRVEIVEILRQEVRSVRANGAAGRRDVLAMLCEATYEDGAQMDEDHVIDEAITLLVGGHETTASSLCWALQHLTTQPEVVRRLQAELATVAPGNASPVPHTHDLPLLDSFIRESMRLAPIAIAVPRRPTRPWTLGEHTVPAGTMMWPAVYLVHRDPALWDEPDAFVLDRFVGHKAPRHHYLPFGGGRRQCLGMAFAMQEIRLVLARMLQRLDLTSVGEADDRPLFKGITVYPADGAPFRAAAR